MVEFQLDFFDRNPLEAYRNKDGHVQFKDTGDDLIDKWEEQVARGETPSMSKDMLDGDALARLERLRSRGRSRSGIGGTFKDVYDVAEREARKQGLLSDPVMIPVPSKWHRSDFGDGSNS